jgi:hypothetical protein
VRNTESIKWVMNIIHDILLIFGVECVRRQFIDAVIDAFRDALLDIISFGDTGNNIVTSYTLLCRDLFDARCVLLQ